MPLFVSDLWILFGKGKGAGFKSWSQAGSHDFTICLLNGLSKFLSLSTSDD